jgi:hypothetical protein
MFIDIMSKDSYLLVNKKMVKHFGLELSTYFAVLLDVYPQVLAVLGGLRDDAARVGFHPTFDPCAERFVVTASMFFKLI